MKEWIFEGYIDYGDEGKTFSVCGNIGEGIHANLYVLLSSSFKSFCNECFLNPFVFLDVKFDSRMIGYKIKLPL